MTNDINKRLRSSQKASIKNLLNEAAELVEIAEDVKAYVSASEEVPAAVMRELRYTVDHINKHGHEFNAYTNSYNSLMDCEIEGVPKGDHRVIDMPEFKRAYKRNDGKWPERLESGVMYSEGVKIRRRHFDQHTERLQRGG